MYYDHHNSWWLDKQNKTSSVILKHSTIKYCICKFFLYNRGELVFISGWLTHNSFWSFFRLQNSGYSIVTFFGSTKQFNFDGSLVYTIATLIYDHGSVENQLFGYEIMIACDAKGVDNHWDLEGNNDKIRLIDWNW